MPVPITSDTIKLIGDITKTDYGNKKKKNVYNSLMSLNPNLVL